MGVLRMVFFVVFCFTRAIISSEGCCDYIFNIKGGVILKNQYRCCFKHENDTCFNHRECWAGFSCMQIATWTIGPCICSLIDNNSCCYINYCPTGPCEFVSKQCLALSLVECSLSLSPCITQDFYDKIRTIFRVKKPKLPLQQNKVSPQNIDYDISSKTKNLSKNNTKNITQNNQKIQQTSICYSYDMDYAPSSRQLTLSSSRTIHACNGSGCKRDDSSDSDD